MHKPGIVSAQFPDGRIRNYFCWPDDTVSVGDTLITSYEPTESVGAWTVGIATVVKVDASIGEGIRPYLLHLPRELLQDRAEQACRVQRSFEVALRTITPWPKF